MSASEKEMEWAQMACHRCLVYLGDLGKKHHVSTAFKALKDGACTASSPLLFITSCSYCRRWFPSDMWVRDWYKLESPWLTELLQTAGALALGE